MRSLPTLVVLPVLCIPLLAGCGSNTETPTPWAGGCDAAGETGIIFVPSDCDTLAEAIDAIADGGSIDIDRGVYSDSLVIEGKHVTLRAREGDGSVVLDAAGEDYAVLINGGSAEITGINFLGADSHAISVIGGSLILTASEISDNQGDVGPGVYLESSTAALEDVIIQRGTATRHGGGMVVVDSTATLNEVQILDNTTGGGPGGALYVTGASSVVWDGGALARNSGGTLGGLVYSASPGAGGIDIQGVTIEDNTITSGPAFYIDGGGLTLAAADFDGLPDGAFLGTVSHLILRRVSVTGSGTLEGEAAFNMSVGSSDLQDVTFSGNAGPEGGVVMRPEGNGEHSWLRVEISDNQGAAKAGGLYLSCATQGPELQLTRGVVSGNTAASGAGGMRVERCSVTGGAVVGNSGVFGGGVGLFDGASLANMVIKDNVAADSGGGVHIGAPTGDPLTLTLDHLWVENNSCTELGAGVNVRTSPVNISNSIFVGQSARLGGALYNSAAKMTLSQVTVVQNTSTGGPGGGLYMDGGTLTLDHGLFYDNFSQNAARHNIFVKSGTATGAYGLYYAEGTDAVEGMPLTDNDVVAVPKLVGLQDGAWTYDSFHLQVTSPAVNAGDPQASDPDGSRADIGAFGGGGARGYDLDGDGLRGWYWPGSFSTPPSGVSTDGFDCDDLDATVSCG